MERSSVQPTDDAGTIVHIYGSMLFRLCLVMLGIFEEFGISSYQVTDMSEKVIIEDAGTELSQISNGQAKINISLDGLESGNYKLIIRKYVGSAKADQPLEILSPQDFLLLCRGANNSPTHTISLCICSQFASPF